MDVSHLLVHSTDFNYVPEFLMTLSTAYWNEDDLLITATNDLAIIGIFPRIKKKRREKQNQRMSHWVTKNHVFPSLLAKENDK